MSEYTTEEELNKKHDPNSPGFDREAYKADLLKLHETMMEQLKEEPQEICSINIISKNFDADAYIDGRIALTKNANSLYDIIENLAQITIKGMALGKSHRDEEEKQTEEKQNRSYDAAVQQGALTTIDNHVAFPSLRAYEDVFTHVMILPKEGTVLENGEVRILSSEELQNAETVNIANLAALFQMTTIQPDSQRILVHLPTVFQREMGIDPRGFSALRTANKGTIKEQRFNAFVDWFKPIESYMLPLNGTYYRACVLEGYDPNSETVTLYPPFFLRLAEELTEQNERHDVLNRYFHADIVNEKNTLAVEVATHLTNKLLQRGLKPDKAGEERVTYRTMYSTIIQNCRGLNKALNEITTRSGSKENQPSNPTQVYNAKLKQVLETAYRLILEKSDFPKMFKDFRINGVTEWEDVSSKKKRKADPKSGNRRTASKAFDIPTKSKLNKTLLITHKGRVKAYTAESYVE